MVDCQNHHRTECHPGNKPANGLNKQQDHKCIVSLLEKGGEIGPDTIQLKPGSWWKAAKPVEEHKTDTEQKQWITHQADE